MSRNSKGHRRRDGSKSKNPSGKPSHAQIGYIIGLRKTYDPLSMGAQVATRQAASDEIARLLLLKAKYETATRQPREGRPRANGQYRYG